MSYQLVKAQEWMFARSQDVAVDYGKTSAPAGGHQAVVLITGILAVQN